MNKTNLIFPHNSYEGEEPRVEKNSVPWRQEKRKPPKRLKTPTQISKMLKVKGNEDLKIICISFGWAENFCCQLPEQITIITVG